MKKITIPSIKITKSAYLILALYAFIVHVGYTSTPPLVVCPSDMVLSTSFSDCGVPFNSFSPNPAPYLTEVRQAGDLILNAGSSGATMAVAYNPDKNLYYSIHGGSTTDPLVTYDMNGTILSKVNAGFDARGMWWNPNTKQLEANSFGSGGYRVIDLDANGYALSTGTNLAGQFQPHIHSFGTYDYDANEVLFQLNDTLYHYHPTTGALITKTPLNGFPRKFANPDIGFESGNINAHALAYTGIAGKELLFYDYHLKRVYVANKVTGQYVDFIQLPTTASFNWLWGFSYAKGQVFVGAAFDYTAFKIENLLLNPVTMVQNKGVELDSLIPLGTNILEFEFMDQSGNKTICSYTVTVNDNVPPLPRCRDITVTLNENGMVTIDSTMFGNHSTDNCEIATMVLSKTTFDCTNIGENIIELTVTDASGNSRKCTGKVTVEKGVANAPCSPKFSISDPCNCSNPSNIELADGTFLFEDKLKITVTGYPSGTVPTITAIDGNLLAATGAPYTIASATAAMADLGGGLFQLPFYTLPNTPSTLTVSVGGNSQDFTTDSCAICVAPIPTMNQWGLLIFPLLILNIGILFVQEFYKY